MFQQEYHEGFKPDCVNQNGLQNFEGSPVQLQKIVVQVYINLSYATKMRGSGPTNYKHGNSLEHRHIFRRENVYASWNEFFL